MNLETEVSIMRDVQGNRTITGTIHSINDPPVAQFWFDDVQEVEYFIARLKYLIDDMKRAEIQ
jgi:hypothetical protein